MLSALIESAITDNDDLFLTVRVDPDSGTRTINLMTGKFVSPLMLRKLIGHRTKSQNNEVRRHILMRLPGDVKRNE